MRVWAIVLRIWPDEPVYHSPGEKGQTKCGRKVGSFMPWLPLKHVKKFARPCKGCFD